MCLESFSVFIHYFTQLTRFRIDLAQLARLAGTQFIGSESFLHVCRSSYEKLQVFGVFCSIIQLLTGTSTCSHFIRANVSLCVCVGVHVCICLLRRVPGACDPAWGVAAEMELMQQPIGLHYQTPSAGGT